MIPQGVKSEILGHHFDFRFRRLVVTHALDTAGNTLLGVALAGTLFFANPSDEARTSVLLYLLFTVAPFAVVSAFLGPLLDRGIGFRRIGVIASGATRVILTWLMATRTESLLLFPLALGALVGQRFYTITRAALVPTCLPPDEPLVRANSFLSRTSAIAGIGAAPVGALVSWLFDGGAVLRIASIAYLGMAVAGFFLPAPRRPGSRRQGPEPHEEVLEPERATMIRPGFRAIAALRVLSGFLLFLFAFALREEAGSKGFGLLALGIGIGALLSSLLAPFLNTHVREDVLVFAAYLGAGLGTAVTARFYSTASAALLAALVGISFGISKLAFDSMVQRGVPRAFHGRFFARWETAFQLFWVAGALVPVGIHLSPRPSLVAAGLLTMIGSVTYAFDVSKTRVRAAG